LEGAGNERVEKRRITSGLDTGIVILILKGINYGKDDFTEEIVSYREFILD